MKTRLPFIVFFLMILISAKTQTPLSNTLQTLLHPFWIQNISTLSQQKGNTITHPELVLNYYWDQNSNNWYLSDSVMNTYNSNGMPVLLVYRNGSPHNRIMNTYDSQDRLIEQIIQQYIGFNWNNTQKSQYAFDAKGNSTLEANYYFDFSTNQWSMSSGIKYNYTYNSLNQLTEQSIEKRNAFPGTWLMEQKLVFSYNTSGNIIQQDVMTYTNSVWANQNRYKFTYSLSNEPVEIIIQEWNNTMYTNKYRYTNIEWKTWCGYFCSPNLWSKFTVQEWGTTSPAGWKNLLKENYTYDNYGGYTEILQMYSGSLWTNQSRYSSIYDVHLNYCGDRYEEWKSSNNTWDLRDETKITHSYNAASNIQQSIYQYWDPQEGYVNSAKYVYSNYQIFTELQETRSEATPCRVFPNPCVSEFQIQIEIKDAVSEWKISLRDALGREIRSVCFWGTELVVNCDDLPKGIYFYYLSKGSEIRYTGKLILN